METEEMRIPDVIKCLCVQFYFIDDNYYGGSYGPEWLKDCVIQMIFF